MSLTGEQRIAELSPSRLAINLFVDCFESDATLRSSPVFWRAAVKYAASAYFETGVFDQLLRAVPAEQLSPYVSELANRLSTADTLEITVKSVAQRIQEGSIKIDPKSFVGSLCCNQALLLDTLDIFGAIIVWRNLVNLFIPFAQALGQNVCKETLGLMLPQSTVERVSSQKLEPMWCLEHRDVEGTIRNFHRSLDLEGGPSGLRSGVGNGQHGFDQFSVPQLGHGQFGVLGGSTPGAVPPKIEQRDAPNQQAKTQELAIIYESFGYISAALEALSQAFASQRRRLIADINVDSTSHGSVETRGMVSWLHRVLAFHDRIAQIPSEMNLQLEQIQDYLRKTAPTFDEKAEVASIDMNEALDSGGSPEFLLSTSMTMIELYPSHWQAHNTAVRNCTFHLLLSIMWFRLGKQHASHSHIEQALGVARSCHIPSLKTHLLSEISFAIGFEFGDPMESIMALQEATSEVRFDEGAQHVRTLLFADLQIQAHNFEAAKNLLEELEDLSLNKFELRTKNALQVNLYRYTGQYYTAYVHAGECVSNMSDEEQQRGCWSVYFRLAGARALVQSEDPLNAIEARCWISECLRASKEFGYANLSLEAALLEARLFFNDGDYRSCHVLCQTLEQDVSTTPQCWLKCEWQLLNAASTQLMTGDVLDLDPTIFRKTIYTEFGNFTGLPRLAAVCLRPRIAVTRDLSLPENPMSAALNDLLDGRLKYSDFPEAMSRGYDMLVDLQNRTQPRDETPVMDIGVAQFSLERLSYVPPPLEDASQTSTPPPPDIKLVPPKSASPSSHMDEEINVSKRLRPMSGSPRKGRKRRSVKLD